MRLAFRSEGESLFARRATPIDAGAVNARNSVWIPAVSAGIQRSRGRETIIGNADRNRPPHRPGPGDWRRS